MDGLIHLLENIEIGSPLQIGISIGLVIAAILFGVLLAGTKADTGLVLLILGLSLIVSEVIKGFYMVDLFGEYPWSDFPFQLCSIPMYMCVLYFFFRKRWMAQFAMVYSLIGAAASFLVPTAVFSPYVGFTIHSLFWHTMLLFLGIFLVLRQTKEDMRIKNFIPVGLAYLVLAGIAVILNSAFYKTSGGRMNMFFLGPGWPNMFILNDIYENSGWIPATLGMIGVSLGAGLGVYLLISLFVSKRKIRKLGK